MWQQVMPTKDELPLGHSWAEEGHVTMEYWAVPAALKCNPIAVDVGSLQRHKGQAACTQECEIDLRRPLCPADPP